MVGLKPAGSIAQGQVTFLEEKAQIIEQELEEQQAFLDECKVGMNEPLVDEEGNPRSDIDVYKIRNIRQRIVHLQNEYSSVINRIKMGLVEINPDLRNPLSTPYRGFSVDALASAFQSEKIEANQNGALNRNKFVINEGTQAFAIIEKVEDESPAAKAGLLADDQLLQFGSITHLNFYDMKQIQDAVTNSIGQNVLVKVRRQSNVLTMVICPQPWAQPGLLGCRIHKL